MHRPPASVPYLSVDIIIPQKLSIVKKKRTTCVFFFTNSKIDNILFVLLSPAEFRKQQSRILFERPADIPFARENEQVFPAEILNPLGVGGDIERGGRKSLVFDPTDMLIGKIGAAHIHTVFAVSYTHLTLPTIRRV